MLAFLCLGQALYIFASRDGQPDPDRIVSVTRVGKSGAIYEVLYDAGGATVPHVYRYFVMDFQTNDEAALQKSKNAAPFLVTNSAGAVRKVVGHSVKLHTQNKIYEFRNTAYFKVDGQLNEVTFDLDAVF